jgi:hypothetical protein
MHDEMATTMVRVLIEMIDARGIKKRGTPLDAVHFIALRKQKFGKIRAILPSDTGNKRPFQTEMLLPDF